MRYPRVEIIKRISYIPIYQENYEVQTIRPNRPMKVKYGLSRPQADSHARRELLKLKKEGYEKAVLQSSMIDLRKFIK